MFLKKLKDWEIAKICFDTTDKINCQTIKRIRLNGYLSGICKDDWVYVETINKQFPDCVGDIMICPNEIIEDFPDKLENYLENQKFLSYESSLI